ncbi:MAG: DUF1559 domain-containing protein [Thermoguttaceae bacterium]
MPDNLERVRRDCAAFSLVELLVVVAIIGVLLALLLPAVQAAREAARRIQCGNHVKQLALAAITHESREGFFPTGGWSKYWLGHPDRGFRKRQPGGWVYNVLPFLELVALHDIGSSGTGMTIQSGNSQRLATPVATFNCPTRRPAALYRLAYGIQFQLTDGPVMQLARSDYAINSGDYFQSSVTSPTTLAEADDPNFSWADMSHQTGISHQRSQVRLADVTDGASNTFLIGEKYISSDHYTDGKDLGDSETMYCGDDLDLRRWTGIAGAIGTTCSNRPVQDRPTPISEGNAVQWFGSAHANTFNMSLCDGSVSAINYSIDAEVYRRLGNREDGQPINGGAF